MSLYDEHDHDYPSPSSGMPLPKTAEEARHQYEQMKSDNLRSLKNSIDFDTDDKGHSSFLGVPVSKEMKPVIELAVDSVKPFIIDQSDKAYTLASKAAARMGFKGKTTNTVGLVAENVFRWGIVGTKQIMDAVRAGNSYAKERRELFHTFAPVLQATGSNIHSNEVIKVAFNDIHENWVTDMKKMAADLPALLPTAVFAWEDQMNSARKRMGLQNHNSEISKTIEDKIAAHAKRVSEKIEHSTKTQEVLATARRDFIKKTKMKDPSGRYMDSKALGEFFDSNIAHDVRETLRHQAYEQSRAQEQGAHGHEKGGSTGKTDKLLWGIIPITSLFSQSLKASIEEESSKRKKRVKAWKMIEQLKHEIETQCGAVNGRNNCDRSFTSKAAEDIMVAGMGNREGDTLNLKEYIVEVFQQHERDREPGRDFRDKNGRMIDPLKGTMLANLMPAVDIIADHIADGSLSPDALYKLVGENKVIVHSKSGARTFANEEQVHEVIDKELLPVLGTREVIKMEEFMAKFADPALIQETLKKNVASMKGTEKALFVSLFPDDILDQISMKKADIVAARKEAHKYAYDFIAATAVYFASRSDEDLNKMGISEQEAASIRRLAEVVESGDVKALKSAVDGRDKEAVDAVRTAGLLEQVSKGEQGQKFWTERVKEMGATHQKIKEASLNNPDEGQKDKPEKEKSWASEQDKGRDRDRDREDNWAGDKHDEGFSSRFEPDRDSSSARERLAKSRDAVKDESHDMRA